MPELLTYGATKALIETLDSDYRKLISDIPGGQPTVLVQQVLQALLSERVSIRNLPLIAEAVAEAARNTTDVSQVTNYVRQRLSNQICKALTDAQGFVPVIALSPAWEREFSEAMRVNGDERNLVMSPQRVQEFVLEARKEIQRFAQDDEWPAIMVSPEARSFVRSMLERVSPATQVVSHGEIHRKATLKTVARIGG
jgi:flagellar biosynthesis protein FlhA